MKRFAFLLGLAATPMAQAETAGIFDHRPIQAQVERDLDDGKLLAKTGEAFDAMFRFAEIKLRQRGERDLAEQLDQEWLTVGSDMLVAFEAIRDTGDHDPFSEWVAVWYARIEAVLGVNVMETTHLRDIWVLNFTLPVVFHPQADSPWCREVRPNDNCRDEYRRHFAGTKYQRDPDPEADKILHHGFAPVITYWAVWAGCQMATSGMGSMLICGPAGSAAEFSIERWVAPGLGYRLYDRAN